MIRIAVSKNLSLDEYIPKELYNLYRTRTHILIGLIDQRVIRADQMLRDHFGPVTINNWWGGNGREWSGLRIPGSPYFSQTSQHSYGRASDKIFRDATPDEVRAYIKDNWEELGITCIEENVTWVHSDVRFIKNQQDILIVYP